MAIRLNLKKLYLAAAALAGALILVPAASAEEWPYRLEIPDGKPAAFELDFPVDHPGTLVIQAEWSGSRILSFRIDPPNRIGAVRRSGPSPQRIEIPIEPSRLSNSGQWKLSIRSLQAGDGGSGMLRLVLPDAEPAVEEPPVEPSIVPEQEGSTPVEPWMLSERPPTRATEQQFRLFKSVEELRREIVTGDNELGLDNCRWQAGMLRYVTYWRDRMLETGEIPPVATRRFFQRVVDAYRGVEEVRSSDDPILAGPVPEDRIRERAWLRVRGHRIEELEAELDSLTDDVRDGHAPELEEEAWPSRFLACLAACERHFEQRVRLGEEEAANLDLALSQWEAISAAAAAMETMVYLVTEEPVLPRDAIAGTQ